LERIVPDNRVRWILNLEEMEDRPWHWMEYEIASEGLVDGLFQNRDGSILCGALDFTPDEAGLYHYLLKIKTAEWKAPEGVTNKGYGFPAGIVGELLALFSLYFRRRFYLVSSSFGELTDHSLKIRTLFPLSRVPCPSSTHTKVFSRERHTWSGAVNKYMDAVRMLDARYHPQFMLAANHYARALKEIGIDEEMVFIRLVSSIEALSNTCAVLAIEEDPLAALDVDGCDLSKSQKTQLKNLLAARKARAKFIKFIGEYSEYNSRGPVSESLTRIGTKDLRKRLQAIYDARSDYLHYGLPMYLSRPIAAFPDWDMEPSLGQITDRRLLPESKKLPNVWWFDGIVRTCLLRFLEKHEKIGDGGPT
jgi:hypothetical protein